ncbi:uncharacterized protein TRAVEDRAFT_43074 [Trametes versicolor FP-101664 SS1]|uniref:uncharacterized protein n=1 Tax=Trametes versicolor (strain FP-101664) TaxID=717944 RepID=UPI0004621FC9|nr:uncharacterized protein TRAVEDRAFT_43074 [Trametes versicolor FP-101664 SS1]EIW62739.1 hypothetical protein TRAVEDRAFT_43074 [Trametes versicolor FP-101664 SS1]
MDFSETHRLREMMDPTKKDVGTQTDGTDTRALPTIAEEAREEDNIEADPYVLSYRDPWDVDLKSPHEDGPSDATIENRMYRDLLIKYLVDHKHDQEEAKPFVDIPEVLSADRMILNESWKTYGIKNEELFLLRNMLIKVDGVYREGHAALHMIYFPHTTERVKEAEAVDRAVTQKSSDSLVLSEHNSPVSSESRFLPHLTQMDIEEFMDELEADELSAHRQRVKWVTAPEAEVSVSQTLTSQTLDDLSMTADTDTADSDHSMDDDWEDTTSNGEVASLAEARSTPPVPPNSPAL